jgi:uncharacterized LabA/DUF88 family protein
MRVALFFDGNNYYRALREFDSVLEVDLERLATWITRRVGGDDARFVGAYYYTGIFDERSGASDSGQALASFLDVLETLNGYFVRREPRVRRVAFCRACQEANEYFTEKRVDTRLVAELIQLAAVDGFDIAFLLSGDGDFVPAVQAVGALGKQVFVGAWPGQSVARDLRAHSFGTIDLGEGVAAFSTGRRRRSLASAAPGPAAGPANVGERSDETELESEPAPSPSESASDVQAHMLEELRLAEAHLPFVSRWYFLNRWRSGKLPIDPSERDLALRAMVEVGLVEEYQVADQNGKQHWALRTGMDSASAE